MTQGTIEPMSARFLGSLTEGEIESFGKKPTTIRLFSGCGSFDLVFHHAGFENRVMIEWDKSCCDTLRANWIDDKHLEQERDPAILQVDITKITIEEILKAGDLRVGEVTAVIGGPPCQGFSMAGKRVIDDPRNKLFKEFVRVVREALPRTFVFEKVPGLVSMAKGEIIKQTTSNLLLTRVTADLLAYNVTRINSD